MNRVVLNDQMKEVYLSGLAWHKNYSKEIYIYLFWSVYLLVICCLLFC